MIVACQLLRISSGVEGVIINASGLTVFRVVEPCAEDAEGRLAAAILRNGWTAVPMEELGLAGKKEWECE